MLVISILLLTGLLAWWGQLWKAVDTSVPLVLAFCCVAGFTQQIKMILPGGVHFNMFDAIFSWQNWASAFLTLPVGAKAAVEFSVAGCANGGGGQGLVGWWCQL
jgi:hypothetical protein